MSIATLPKTVRTFSRLRVIAQVLSRHGFGHFVDGLQLSRYLPSMDWVRRGRPTKEEHEAHPLEAIGARLVRVCEELGPTFVKLGQMASTRPDVLPAEIQRALERLQDDVDPFPSEQARRIFHDDTGSTVEEAFRDFNDTPFASGSIGQVHRAITNDGQEVVVKIRRPGIDQTVQLDIYVLQWLADRAEQLFPELRPYRPRMLIEEFAQTIRRELDFVNEASATARFYTAFEKNPNVRTPQVRWDLTGPRTLTLEYMRGVRLRDVTRGTAEACDQKALAKIIAECFLHQLFELGLFHADPHPGNMFVEPPSSLILFDFGMIGEINEELMGHLVVGLVAAIKRQPDMMVDVLADLGAVGRSTDRALLSRDLSQLLAKYYGLPLKRLDMSVIFRELIDTVRRNDVSLPRDFVAMFKALATVSGVVTQLDPELDLASLIQPKLSKLIRKRLAPDRLLRVAGMSGWHLLHVLKEAPRFLRDLMRGIGRGQFQVNIRHENLDYLASELDRSSNRLAFSILMAATIMGSSMLLSMDAQVKMFGIELRHLGFLGYTLSAFMAIILVVAIWRSGKL